MDAKEAEGVARVFLEQMNTELDRREAAAAATQAAARDAATESLTAKADGLVVAVRGLVERRASGLEADLRRLAGEVSALRQRLAELEARSEAGQ